MPEAILISRADFGYALSRTTVGRAEASPTFSFWLSVSGQAQEPLFLPLPLPVAVLQVPGARPLPLASQEPRPSSSAFPAFSFLPPF